MSETEQGPRRIDNVQLDEVDPGLNFIDERLAEIYRYWQSKCPAAKDVSPDISPAGDGSSHGLGHGVGTIPLRKDIDPAEITALLPFVYLMELEDEPAVFRCRLAGTQLREAGGQEVTGRLLEEIYSPEMAAGVAAYYLEILETCRPQRRQGRVTGPDAPTLIWESVVMPLSKTGDKADMLLGLMIFRDTK